MIAVQRMTVESPKDDCCKFRCSPKDDCLVVVSRRPAKSSWFIASFLLSNVLSSGMIFSWEL